METKMNDENPTPPEPMSEEEIKTLSQYIGEDRPSRTVAEQVIALLREGNENRKRIANVVDYLEGNIDSCCREKWSQRFCESYGCVTLMYVIKKLKGEV